MKTIFSWIKWKTYIRWKSTWGSFYFVRGKWGERLGLLILFIDSIKAILYTTVYYSIFTFIIFNRDFSKIDNQNSAIGFLISKVSSIQNNSLMIWNVYFLILFIYCVFVGIKSSIWSQFSEDKELLSNTKISKKYTRALLLFESIIWNYRNFVLNIVTLGISLNLAMGAGFINLAFFFIISNSLYIILSLYFALIHYFYIFYRSYWMKGSILVLQIVLSRLILIYVGYKIASIFQVWIRKAPFYSSEFTNADLELWTHEGYSIVTEKISFLFTSNWIPYNFISSLYLNDKIGVLFVVLFALISIIFFILLIFKKIFTFENYKSEYNYTILPYMEKLHRCTIFKIPILDKKRNFFNIFFRSPIVFRKLDHLVGGLFFWGVIGLFSGLLSGAELHEKYSLFVIYLIVYFNTYFFCEYFYNHFKGLLALDSEGEKALIYLNTSQNLWMLLKQKILIFSVYTILTTLISQIILAVVSGCNLNLMIWLLFSQTSSLIMFILFLLIPSVYNAHFNFFNIEQVGEFADQKTTSSIINLVITGVLIPILMIPCILYLFEKIDLTKLIFVNCIMILVQLLVSVLLIFLFKKKVSHTKYFWGRY
ncbi:hypothetical protein [Bacillus pumilus]|uniref:hypothetical protein n=1 Tax=Bacillus pumilus TaxID=1408 RepID=UPI000DDCE745|nr:hypothetical protein [Bacillus pumilus]